MRPDGFGIFRTMLRYNFYQMSIGLIHADLRPLPAVVPGAGVCIYVLCVCAADACVHNKRPWPRHITVDRPGGKI